MRRGVRAGPGDHRGAIADRIDCGRDQLEALVVRECRRLAGRGGDDEPVGAVLDEVRGQFPEALVVHRAVGVEGRDDRGQDLA